MPGHGKEGDDHERYHREEPHRHDKDHDHDRHPPRSTGETTWSSGASKAAPAPRRVKWATSRRAMRESLAGSDGFPVGSSGRRTPLPRQISIR
jgi:hypothetical protein